MTLSFPLGPDDFARKLKVAQFNWYRKDFVEMTGTARGDILTAEIAPSKWAAEVTLARYNNRDADDVQALFEAILPHGRFHLFNSRRPFPAADPTGSILGNGEPILQAIGSDRVSLRISGLPANYVISRGDMVAFNRGSDAARRSLHRIVETDAANGSGLTPWLTVRPAIRPDAQAGVRVFLKRPSTIMMIPPGTFTSGVTRKMLSDGCAFQAIEAVI